MNRTLSVVLMLILIAVQAPVASAWTRFCPGVPSSGPDGARGPAAAMCLPGKGSLMHTPEFTDRIRKTAGPDSRDAAPPGPPYPLQLDYSAQPAPGGSVLKPAEPGPKTYTIRKIEAVGRKVWVHLSHPLPLGSVLLPHLIPHPQVLPRIEFDLALEGDAENSMLHRQIVVLTGDFEAGRKYRLQWPGDFRLYDRSYRETVNSFTVKPAPEISYLDERNLVERRGRQLVHLRSNVDTLLVESLRLPPLLLPLAEQWVRTDDSSKTPAARPDWDKLTKSLKKLSGRLDSAFPATSPFRALVQEVEESRQVFHSEKSNRLTPVSIPLTFRKHRDRGGLELLRVQDEWTREKISAPLRLLAITDLALTYKRTAHRLLIWATTLSGGTPVADAELFALDANRRLFALGRTGADGLLTYRAHRVRGLEFQTASALFPGSRAAASLPKYHLKTLRDELPVSAITRLVAITGDDVTTLAVHPDGEWMPQHLAHARPGQAPAAEFKGELFTDRGVYRPGDTVHFKGVVRRYDAGAVTAARSPVRLRITDARGQEVYAAQPEASAFGSVSGSLALTPALPLGTYTITMAYGGNQSARHTFEVQEYRAPRHFAKVSFSDPRRQADAHLASQEELTFVDIHIEGGYYAGGPVKHGRVRWKIYHAGTEFSDPRHTGYRFGNAGAERTLLESSESLLDENGQLKISFPLDAAILSGRKSLDVVATLVDFDGRAFTARKRYQAEPAWRIGIGKHAESMKAGVSMALPLMVLPAEGETVPASLNFSVFRQEYQYVRKRGPEGNLYWDWTDGWARQYSGLLPTPEGQGAFDFNPAVSGQYRVEFSHEAGGQRFSSSTHLNVGWGWRRQDRERPFEAIEILMDRESYRPGETAVLTLRPGAPVSHYLITLERNDIREQRVLAATGDTETLRIPLTADHAPNVYVSVLGTLARKEFPLYTRSVDDGAPSFRFGAVNLPVNASAGTLNIDFGPGAESAEPGTETELDITVTDAEGRPASVEMALGVVDERVLALSGYQTPDLSSLARFTLPLQTATADLRQSLVMQTPMQWIWNPAWTGGGGSETPDSPPSPRKNFNPVAFFDPALTTDRDGRVRIRFQLPDAMTTYRIYAVAMDRHSAFGKAQRGLRVTRDFYIEPGLPRFFTRGDRFKFDVAAFNATGQDNFADLDLTAPPELDLAVAGGNRFIADGDSARFAVRGEARHSGRATVGFNGRMAGRRDGVSLEIPVHTGQTVETRVWTGSFEDDTLLPLALPQEVTQAPRDAEFLKDVRVELTFATTPFLGLVPGLDRLMKYPYGCVEQTSSGVLPLAALRGWVQKGAIPGLDPKAVDRFLAAGVARLMSMQTESGGFAYWPGRDTPHPEGTLYALAALSVARNNGFVLPEPAFQKALDYLAAEARQGHYPQQEAFAHYLLALNGRLDPALTRLRRLPDRKSESAYFRILAGILTRAWDAPDLAAWLEAHPGPGPAPEAYGEFANRHRVQAIALLAATALAPDRPATQRAAARLLRAMASDGTWGNTSDTGWVLFALGEYYKVRGRVGEAEELTVQAGEEAPAVLSLREGSAVLTLDPEAFLRHPRLEIRGEPGKTVFYQARLAFPRFDYAVSGHFQGWKVRKSIENLDGTGTVRVGDLVRVTLRFEADSPESRGRFRYFVLDDPLPAGLVAINSALATEEDVEDGEERDYDGSDDTWRFRPSHLEIRDDRVLAFKDRFHAWGPTKFTYYARAVAEGEFILPSTRVQLMYAPEVHGFTPVTQFIIEGR